MADPAPGAVLPAAPAPAAAPVAPKAPVTLAPAAPSAQSTPAAAPKPGAPAAPAAAPAQVPLATLMEEREKRQAMQAELEQLRSTVQQIQQRQPAPGFQPQAQPQVDMRAQLEQMWKDDPRKAVQTEIMLATQWMDNVNAQVDTEASALGTKYHDFNDYRDTAMRYVRALPLEQRARPGIVEMAYLVTRGQNVDKIIEAQRNAMATQFQQNPAMFQTPPGASAGPIVQNQTQATDAEVRAAGAMKIPIDQYLKWKK